MPLTIVLDDNGVEIMNKIRDRTGKSFEEIVVDSVRMYNWLSANVLENGKAFALVDNAENSVQEFTVEFKKLDS